MKTDFIKNKFLNLLMCSGNKQTSEKLLIKSLKKIQTKFTHKNCKDFIKTGLINASPVLFVKNIKRKRKRTMEFPFLLNENLRLFYSLKFIIKNSSKKNSQTFYNKLTTELIESVKNISQSVKIKKNLYKDAALKKKFANYRWF